MTLQEDTKNLPPITYSCYFARSREGEQFVKEHVFSYQISGSLIMNDGDKVLSSHPGDFRLTRRAHLLKFLKVPPEGGEFKSLSIYLDQETLRKFSLESGFTADNYQPTDAVIALKPDSLFKSFMDSLQPYQQLTQPGNEKLLALKQQEAIFLLLKVNPDLKNVLFDFADPGKIDLEAFMNRNFHFNVELKRFAYLTGRSLATFKRDFERIFHNSPSRWLQQRRLQEAHYLIKEQRKAPSDVYLELGFEDLSHFSFAFKKMYGVAPSKL